MPEDALYTDLFLRRQYQQVFILVSWCVFVSIAIDDDDDDDGNVVAVLVQGNESQHADGDKSSIGIFS